MKRVISLIFALALLASPAFGAAQEPAVDARKSRQRGHRMPAAHRPPPREAPPGPDDSYFHPVTRPYRAPQGAPPPGKTPKGRGPAWAMPAGARAGASGPGMGAQAQTEFLPQGQANQLGCR